MLALRLTAPHQSSVGQVPDPIPERGQVLVALRAAALNHRDVWIKSGDYAGVRYPCIPGSDGAGTVLSAGPDADPTWIGRDVIVNPSFDWGQNPRAQGEQFSILGLPRDGTLAERVAVPANQLASLPAHLSWNEAAALPLAGLTAYRALFARGGLAPKERVLISGIGGGVAVFLLQFAVAAGAEAWVTSSSEEKIDRARSLGARGGFLYNRDGWEREAARAAGAFDLVVDSAGGGGFEQLLNLAAPGGRVVFFGATRGNPPSFPLRKVFWRQISLLGTTMGSPADWADMTEFVSRKKIRPVVGATFPLERATDAIQLMEKGGQFGKIVVQMPQ